MIYETTVTAHIARLFDGWEETIIWSCLQGVMGKLYANDTENPTAVMAILADFAFFAGRPDAELAAHKPEWCRQDFIILVPQNDAWKELLLRCYGTKATIVTRYAFHKEPDIFDIKKLEKIVSRLPAECDLSIIDEHFYNLCRAESWSRDLVAQFKDYETFHRLGTGVVLHKNHVILSGASSYTRYREGIEVQIDTREDFQRQGFACLCGAKLILECRKQNLYPSWDAQNAASAALAQKLGYRFSHTYAAIEIRGYFDAASFDIC